ncbi:MAG: CDP-glycerol glycerophosphotransferase family protein [Candidatus Gastranaerophilales bacterium]|nr:CDP-glycerol glycerophosphotransferase family protein [Candidatus Gastranaerophilales bacterium]MCM1073681.1 CDP-glycerol glycerophosphotransferase family protein [Bacteroides sp.]
MYINYNKLIDLGICKSFFYKMKIKQNLAFIKKNKTKVLNRLANQTHYKVIFYVYDCAKWKCQSLYDLMGKSKDFTPLIVVTKNAANNIDNPSYQTQEEILNTFEFFKSRGMNVEMGYNFTLEKHIPLKEFEPDIIIYQHPWYVETSQGPVVCSEFALTAYIPYDIATTNLPSDYNLRFHNYVENFFVFNNSFKEYYSQRMDNKGENIKVTGALALDYFTAHPPKNEKQYVIYAPHWTVKHEGTIAYSTFAETGKFMLEYAKRNPQFNWLFKPHPMLKKALIDNKIMTKQEVKEYYNSWSEACFDGDYFKYFNDSQLMITDCSTFLLEYAVTQKPLIRLVSKNMPEFNTTTEEVVKTYYNAQDIQELEKYLDMILKEKNDPMKKHRKGFPTLNTAKQILSNLL